ncbi:MAG: (d)CMP kinase [Chloroflexi bacterium]|nr:(d)CMP kinase [Chloroflexota bacterium]
MSQPFVVALDGPAASGKTTVAARAADRLGFFAFDTGVLYRALTWLALDAGVDPRDEATLAELAQRWQVQVGPPSHKDGRQADVRVNGRDVSTAIRAPEVDARVSVVSAFRSVRAALRETQRAAVRPPGTILVGRDIGTVIAPDARLKIWLAASPEQRARRRADQTGAPYAEVLRQMRERDRIDESRAVAPMRPADDAVVIDTDALSADEVVERVVALVEDRSRAVDHW